MTRIAQFFMILMLLTACVSSVNAQQIGINSVTVRFTQPPSSYTVSKTPLRYNKDFAFAFHLEDGNKDIYTHAFPLLNGGVVNGITYPGYFYTDGAGNQVPFKMAVSVFSFLEGDSIDVHKSGNPFEDEYATWSELDQLYQHGWGIYNQGLDSAGSADDYYAVQRNHSYIKRMMQADPEMKVLVNENGSPSFASEAFDKDYIAALGPYSFGIPGFDVTVFTPSDSLKMGRTFLGNDDSMSDLVDTLAAQSVSGARQFGSAYTSSITEQPGYIFPVFRAHMNLIEDTYGRYGNDNIWMTTEEEIISYLMVNDNISIYHQLIGNELVIYFDSDVPTDLRFYASTLIVDADAIITEIEIDGGTNNTWGGTGSANAIINLEWNGYVPVPDSVNAENYVSIAEQTQLQTDWNIAYDYVEILEPGPLKEYFRDRLCDIDGVTPPEGYCDCSTFIGADTTICAGDCITLSVDEGAAYEWSTGDTTQSIFVCPEDSTTYWVTVTNELGCPATDSITVYVSDYPVPEISNDTNICASDCIELFAGGGESYVWSTGDTTAVITVCPEEGTLYEVEVFNEFGCSASENVWVSVTALPVVNAGPDTTICKGNSVTLTAGGGNSFEWSNGDTTFWTIVTPDTTTTYYVEVWNAFGCSVLDSVLVAVLDGVQMSLTPDTGVCMNSCIDLHVEGGETYLWSTGDTTSTITVCPTDTTIYTVTAFQAGCSRTEDVKVGLYPVPQAVFNPEVFACYGDTAFLETEGGDYYVWQNSDTTDVYEIIALDTSYIHVEIFNNYHCSVQDSILLNAVPLPEVSFWGIEPAYCETDEAVIMYAFPGPGWYTGPGVEGNIFDPAIAGPGIHPVAYHFTEINTGCTGSDTLLVNVSAKPEVDLGADTVICNDDILVLHAGEGYDSYLWSTGDTTSSVSLVGADLQEGENVIEVVVTNGGCATFAEKNVTMQICNPGIEESAFGNFSLYPNPADEEINISFNTNEKQSIYRIYNSSGLIVKSGNISTCAGECKLHLSVADLPEGVYCLQMINRSGFNTVKFIVE